MEIKMESAGILELIAQPAFAVQNGVIVQLNQSARLLLLETGMEVAPMLGDDAEDYAQFQGGCLCVTLNLVGIPIDASIHRIDGTDIFALDPARDQTELHAMQLIACQLRTPLSNLKLALDNMDGASDQVMKAKRQMNILQRMALNMADAFRYGSDRANDHAFVDVCDHISECMNRIEPMVTGCGLRLEFSRCRDPFCSLIDEEKVERALYNMISNAMKASSHGDTIQVQLTREDKQLRLSIRDYGRGIQKEKIDTLFCRYRRQPGLDVDGIGLGMTLIRATAISHGGTLLVSPLPDGGTLVCMTIALRKHKGDSLRSPKMDRTMSCDYAGEQDHVLLELADVLPDSYY